MIKGPQYHYPVQPGPLLDSVENLIPGVEVHGLVGRRWERLRDLDADTRRYIPRWQLRVAYHSAWLVYPTAGDLVGHPTPVGVEGVVTGVDEAYLSDYGSQIIAAGVARGELLPALAEKATVYQRVAAGLAGTLPQTLLVWPPGGGKTPGAVAAIASRPGDVLVLCPAGARKEWRADRERGPVPRTSIEKFSTWETYRLLPKSQRTKTTEPLAEYLARMAAESKRAIVVAGIEALPALADDLGNYWPAILVIDEIHNLGDRDRWTRVATPDGAGRWDKVTTKTGEQTRSNIAKDLSIKATIKCRIALTGTPLDDGRPRRLWAPLDLISPGGFGTWSAFRSRYCDPGLTKSGHVDDGGSSNLDELRARCSFFLHRVSRATVREAMGKAGTMFRPEVVYLTKAEQNRPDAFAAELKKLSKAAESGPAARGRLREAKLAQACSCKRDVVMGWAREYLEGAGKVVIMLGRVRMVEAWGSRLLEKHPGVTGWVVHDEHDDADAAVEAFEAHPGPCWLIGTGHKIGQSKNGMQCADLGVIAQLPEKPGQWDQWIGRFDRFDGKGTVVRVPLAEGTQDDIEAGRLVRKFGSIERFLQDTELRQTLDALDGIDDPGLEDSLIAKLDAAESSGDLEMD